MKYIERKEEQNKRNNQLINNKLNLMKPIHRKCVKKYIDIRRIDNISEITLSGDTRILLQLSEFIGNKPYQKITEDDFDKYIKFLKKKYTQGTFNIVLTILKKFYKFIDDEKEFRDSSPKQRSKLTCRKYKFISRVEPFTIDDEIKSAVLTYKDIETMRKVCTSFRDSALVEFLFDAGPRVEELVYINFKDVELIDKNTAIVKLRTVKGKKITNENDLKNHVRYVTLYTSVQYLQQFMENHPFKDYPDAPLFYSLDQRKYSKLLLKMTKENLTEDNLEKVRLRKTSVTWIVKKIGTDAGIKNIYVHLFRHSSATHMADLGMSDFDMRRRYGWSKKSNMPSRYVHSTKKRDPNQQKKLFGIEVVEKDEIIQNVQCVKCETFNPPSLLYCKHCRYPLNLKLIEEKKEKERKQLKEKMTEEILNDLLQSDKLKKMIKKELLG